MVQTNKETNTLTTIFEQANKQTNKQKDQQRQITHMDCFHGNGHKLCIYCFQKPADSRQGQVPYNKLLTNRASSRRTGEYWPSVVFVRNSLHSVRSITTSGQYSSTALALG